jgi:hypothetical protein
MRFLLAAECTPAGSVLPDLYKGVTCNPATGKTQFEHLTDITIVIGNLIQIGMTLAGGAAVILIVWGGIKYITSVGDPGRTQSAKATIRNAVVGLILASSAYLLVQFFASGIGGTL